MSATEVVQEPSRSTTVSSESPTLLEVKPKQDGSPTEHFSWVTAGVCLLCGMSHLWFWNCILNMMNGIQTTSFPDSKNVSDTLTAVFETCALFGTIIPTIRGALRQANSLGFAALVAVASLGVGVCLHFWSGTTGGLVGVHICCGFAGFGVGMVESVQFAFAGCMPGGVFTGYTSMGQGFCGVATFTVFMIISRLTMKEAFLSQAWTLMGLGAGLLFISSLVLHMHCRRPDVRQNIKALRAALREERSDPNAPTWLQLFMESKLMIFNVFWAFLITFLIYPNIGPLRWNVGSTGIDVGVGLFQLGDFCGRLIPLLAKWFPWVLLKRDILTILNVSMVGILAFSICAWRLPGVSVFGNSGLLCFVLFTLALCAGWYGTVALIRAPLSLTGEKAKYRGRLAAMTIVSLLLGITIGLWTATLVGRTVQ